MNAFDRMTGTVGLALACLLSTTPAQASPFAQSNLVSNVPGLAQITDADLRNPWGMSFSPTGPFWISNQGSNNSTLYRVTNGVAVKQALTVTTPMTSGGPQGPTGQVFANIAGSFLITSAANSQATFIFANLNGTIDAWNGAQGTAAVVKASVPGAVYTGLAISTDANGPRLFAADGAHNAVNVFDASFTQLTIANAFVNNDPRLAGLVPFNVEVFGNRVYVTYAPAGRAAQIAAPEGSGAVAVFDTNGTLLQTLTVGGKLASPWGLALAPASFGSFGGDLLVGNFSFGVSEINAFDPVTGDYKGTLADINGNVLLNPGLWDIAFGNASAGANTLYFNAGINGERDGLFGSITAVPEPAPLLLMALGLAAIAIRRRRG